ncbi:MAG: YegP family protein [Deltaproteobacteria bacterium]|nr:YegP family protein [Deltaproteobacteria bacterium]
MAGKFELYRDKADEFRFRLKAGNGENIGLSEGYKTKAAALKGIESVRTNAEEEVQYIYKTGKDDKVYFNLKAKNHQVILSSQGYASENGAKNGVKSVMQNALDAAVVEL